MGLFNGLKLWPNKANNNKKINFPVFISPSSLKVDSVSLVRYSILPILISLGLIAIPLWVQADETIVDVGTTLTNPAETTLTNDGEDLITINGTLDNQGDLQNNGTINNNNNLDNTGALINAGALNNAGTLLIQNGSMTNENGATLTNDNNFGVFSGTSVTNQGTVINNDEIDS
ncbi:MAG: hypothetical protein VYA80_04490, partial [Pseudomonadota bacterium]|nr:hypothetical protein [Pseudomonadota bacterium]